MSTYTKKSMPDVMVNDATGAVLADNPEATGVDVSTGEAQQAGDNANHAIAVPADTQKVILNADGGEFRWKIGGAASATSGGRVPKDGTIVLRVSSASSLNVYVPNGTTVNAAFTKRV